MEVIVAVAITAIITTTVVFLFTQGVISNRDTKDRQTASQVAENRLEELRNMPFSEMINQSEDIVTPELLNGHRITRIKTSYGTDIKEVEVEVTWTGKEGLKSAKINTLIYNYGS